MSSEPSTPYVLSLSDPRARDASLAGGKASRLAALRLAGHPVPDGFVLTTAAFERGAATTGLRPAAHAELRVALDALGGRVAVRSSGVAEDLAGASFAGQYETVLDVEGIAAVEAAVATCAASASSARVLAYRQQRGLAEGAMAVLVQRFVPAKAAGVAFTAHPVTGECDVVVVSAVAGVGEGLVSGLADGEEWEVRQAPARVRGASSVLRAEDADAVASLARRVAAGAPTDVEWALTDERGATVLHLLQARPMTALPESVSWDGAALEGTFIRNFRLGEWIGAPVTPLFESWILNDLERKVHGYFEELCGLAPPSPLHVVVNGWYFYGGMNYDTSGGAVLKALPRLLRTLFGKQRKQLLASVPPVAHLGFDSEVQRWREQLLPELRAVVAAAQAEVEQASPHELIEIAQSVIDATADQLASIVGVAGYSAKVEAKLLAFHKKRMPDFDGSMIELVAGARHEAAAHDVEGLDPIFPTLGERGSLPPPPSAETRARVLARRDAAESRWLAALPPKHHESLQALIKEARRAHAIRMEQTGLFTLGWPVLRRALLRLGEGLARGGQLAAAGDVFFLTRDELRARLAGEAEPVATAERRETWQRQRKLAPPLLIGPETKFFKEVYRAFLELLHHPEHDEKDALVGMPGSAGRVTGTARVIRSVDDLHTLRAGEILVAPVTTPAWTLAFERALAVVTDTGSVASHASIVAREHGIPAVVGTGNATQRIADGQRVTVDGGRGLVRLSSEP